MEQLSALAEGLRRGHDVRCELGTIRLHERAAYEGRNPRTGEGVPVPAKRYPIFAPSPRLLAAAFVGEAVPVPADRYTRELAAGEARLYDLTSADASTDEHASEPVDARVGTVIEEIAVGDDLVREIGKALREKKKLAISGFGTFRTRRLPRRRLDADDERRFVDADLVGKWIVAVKFSHVLLDALRLLP